MSVKLIEGNNRLNEFSKRFRLVAAPLQVDDAICWSVKASIGNAEPSLFDLVGTLFNERCFRRMC